MHSGGRNRGSYTRPGSKCFRVSNGCATAGDDDLNGDLCAGLFSATASRRFSGVVVHLTNTREVSCTESDIFWVLLLVFRDGSHLGSAFQTEVTFGSRVCADDDLQRTKHVRDSVVPLVTS